VATDLARRAEALVLQLVERDAASRAALLDQECAGDTALRAEVESLLAHLDPAKDFLDPGALHTLREDAIDGTLGPGTRVGRYTVLHVLGSGGMGVVYVAEQERPRRTVALKVLRRSLSTRKLQRRFELEAELLGRLQHPGIAQIFEAHAGDDETPPFIAMELIDGRPLVEYASTAAIDVDARLDLVARVADAVQHAHQRGVLHRDLKPANILVDVHGQPRILDFGVARSLSGEKEHTTLQSDVGQIIGTLAYMSPEQIAGTHSDLDVRVDVYALGVMLYQLLTGRLPHDLVGRSLPEATRIVLETTAPRLAVHDRSLRGALEPLVARALEKDRAARYQSAADLAADIRRYRAGLPIVAAGDYALAGLAARLRRYRRAVAVVAAVGAALVGLTGYALWQRGDAQRAGQILQQELTVSNIERARLLGRQGALGPAEATLWREHLAHPGLLSAYWALWELYSRFPVRLTLTAHPGGATSVAVSDRGRLLASAGNDRVIQVVDLETGRPIRAWRDLPGVATHLSIARTNDRVAAAFGDGTVRVWKVSTGALVATLQAHPPGLTAVAISADGSTVLSGGVDGRVLQWSLTNPLPLEVMRGPGPVHALRLSTDDAGVLVGFSDGSVQTSSLDGAHVTRAVKASTLPVTAVAFAPDGQSFAAGGRDAIVRVWGPSGDQPIAQFDSDNGTTASLDVSPSGRLLLAAGAWHLDVWDLETRQPRPTGIGATSRSVQAVFAGGGDAIVAAEASGRLRVWDAAPQRAGARLPAQSAVMSLGTSAAGLFATGTANGMVTLWEPGDDEPRWQRDQRSPVTAVAVDPAGTWVASAGTSGLSVWQATTGDLEARLSRGGADTTALAVGGKGRLLAEGAANGDVRLWDVSGAQLIRTLSASNDVVALAVSSDGSRLAVAERDGAVLVYQPDGTLVSRLDVETPVYSLALTGDGRRLAMGDFHGGLRIRDLDPPYRDVALSGHVRVVTALSWDPEGKTLISASRDGSVRLWDPSSVTALATLTEDGGDYVSAGYLDASHVAARAGGAVTIWDLRFYNRHIAGNAGWFESRQARER
jgi:WD40 repeat protein/predicted Ser/Thr protein kinase